MGDKKVAILNCKVVSTEEFDRTARSKVYARNYETVYAKREDGTAVPVGTKKVLKDKYGIEIGSKEE